MDISKLWSVASAVGGRNPLIRPVFYEHDSKVIVVSALAVKSYDIRTHQVVLKLPIDGYSVRQVFLKNSEDELLAVSKNGLCEVLGLQNGETQALKLDKTVLEVISFDNSCITAICSAEGGKLGLVRFTLQSDNSYSSDVLFSSAHSELYAVSKDKQYVAFGSHNNKEVESEIQVYSLSHNQTSSIPRSKHNIILAVSNSGIVAAAARSGVIEVYFKKSTRALKWHLEPISALEFSDDEEYLMSGGQERVLVFWQTHADKQQFLPRLECSIHSITLSKSGSLYGIVLDNGQITVISAVDLLTRLSVGGVKVFSPKPKVNKKKKQSKSRSAPDVTAICAIQPGSRLLYMVTGNVRPGQGTTLPSSKIQCFNILRDEEEQMVNLAPHIQQGRVRKERYIYDAQVTQLGFLRSGKVMITVDVKLLPPIDALASQDDREINLKFWKFDEEQQKWALDTRVASPHGQQIMVAGLVCSPIDESAITVATDGGIRLWKRSSLAGSWQVKRMTEPLLIGSMPGALAWSEDGSAFAVSYGLNVKIYNANSFECQYELPCLVPDPIKALLFCGSHLIIVSKTRMTSWNLVAAQQSWSLKVHGHANFGRLIACDKESSESFACAFNFMDGESMRCLIALVSPVSPAPKAAFIHNKAVTFLSSVPDTKNYAFVDTDGIIHTINLKGGAANKLNPANDLDKEGRILHQLLVSAPSLEPTEHVNRETGASLSLEHFENTFDTRLDSLELVFERVLGLINPASED